MAYGRNGPENYTKGYNNTEKLKTVEDFIKESIKIEQKLRQDAENKRNQEAAKIALKYAEVTGKALSKIQLKQLKKELEAENKEKIKWEDRFTKEAITKRKANLKAYDQAIKDEKDPNKVAKLQQKAQREEFALLGQQVYAGLTALSKKIGNEVDNIINQYSAFQSKINVRLQGSGKSAQQISKAVASIQSSPFIQGKELYNNLVKAAETGIAFNIEQRAYLATISEKVASTFDAFDASLLSIIKLQQSDSTASRLGMEAYLTSYLNNMFENSEYLSNGFDNVTQALLTASSQMTTENSISFEYQVQKWLGSLSSVGLSSNAVSSLASAIGSVATGDVNGLASNSGMQNLLIMAASRSGESIANLLTKGLDESSTNNLLKSIVEYIQEIAKQDNKVVKAQYASLFGISVSDMTAALNLGVNDLTEISKSTMSYRDTISELIDNQMSQLVYRVSASEQLENIYENFMWTTATKIAENPLSNFMWKLTSMLEKNIENTSVSILGNSVDVVSVAKLAIMGAGALIGGVGSVVNSLSNYIDPTTSLRQLGIGKDLQTVSRGTGLSNKQSGTGVSQSGTVGNTAEDVFVVGEESIRAEAVQEAEKLPEAAIRDYLLYSFDSKFNYLLSTMSAGSYSAPINSSASSNVSSADATLNSLLANSGKTMVAIQSADASAQENKTSINVIENNVTNIYNLLQGVLAGNALRVSVDSTGGFLQ